jgi:iron complex outermembrane receptor protein
MAAYRMMMIAAVGGAMGWSGPILAQDGGQTGQAPMLVLPTVSTEGEVWRERGDGPVEGYRATRTTSGAKIDTDIKSIPQTITVVPREVIEDTGGSNVEKALDYVGGVAKGNNFGGLNVYEINVRGLPTRNSAKNGFTAGRRYDAASDAANIERVETMMGPSGALYGRSDPGGFYNIVTKQPNGEDSLTLSGSYGSYDAARATLDANLNLNDSGNLLGRLNAASESRDSFRDYVHSQRDFFSPVLTWQPNDQTRLIAEAELVKDERTFDRGLVAVQGAVRALPTSRFLGEPNDGEIRNENYLANVRLEHDLSSAWMVRLGLQGKTASLEGWTAEPGTLQADNRTLTRTHQLRDYGWESVTTQLEAVGKLEIGGMRHTVLFGTEYEYFQAREILNRSTPGTNPYSIDIFNPVYGQAKPAVDRFSSLKDQSDVYGFYVQDQIEITPRLKIQAGVRIDWYDQTMQQRSNGTQIDQYQHGVTPRAGVVYELTPDLSLFASVAESFRPNLDADTGFVSGVGGKPFDPERGVGYEAGVKFDLFDDALSVTAAAFHIVKQNVITADPNNPGFSTAAGEVRSQGFDINLSGNITREWRVIGGYAYVDAQVTKDNTIRVGAPFANVSQHSLSLLNVYEVMDGPLAGFGIGAGISLVGDRAADSTGSGVMLPGYFKTDALAYYRLTSDTKINLNVYNLFDREYYERGFGSTRIVAGAPLTALVSLTKTF